MPMRLRGRGREPFETAVPVAAQRRGAEHSRDGFIRKRGNHIRAVTEVSVWVWLVATPMRLQAVRDNLRVVRADVRAIKSGRSCTLGAAFPRQRLWQRQMRQK